MRNLFSKVFVYKYSRLLLVVSIFVVVGFVIYSSRQIFFYKYEPEYYENYYYHSQWAYPNSNRGISDDELYKFIGYRLIEGENPFNVNFEIPPFGKSLYGLAEMYLGNPYWISLIFYLFSIIIFFLFSKELFDNKFIMLTLLLFVTTPFIATQLQQTMLDLPMMFLYLIHTWMFIKFLSNQKYSTLIASGVFLGLATGTKPGVYTPFVLVLGFILIFFTTKKILDLVYYSGSVFAGYVISFYTYFIRHPNPIPWLRLHEKQLKFYIHPDSTFTVFLDQWRLIFFNYQDWHPDNLFALGDGTLILPLGVVVLVIILIKALRKRDKKWIYITGLTLVFLIVNTLISIYPRYLMPTIPLFVLMIVYFFRKVRWVILLLILINIPFLVTSLASNNPSGDVQAAARFITTRAYRELYRSVTPLQRENLSETDFINHWEGFLEELGTRAIEVEVGEIDKSKKQASVKFKIKYVTKYGELVHEPTIVYVKSRNQWKISWQWDYLWPGYTPESKLVINEKSIPILRLEDKNGTVLARRGDWMTVYVIPRVMFDWNKHLAALSEVTGDSAAQVNDRVRSAIPDKYPRYIGYLDPKLTELGKDLVVNIPGATLDDNDYLVIPDSSLSREPIAQQIKDLQGKNPELFYINAEIYLENANGEKEFIKSKEDFIKDTVITI